MIRSSTSSSRRARATTGRSSSCFRTSQMEDAEREELLAILLETPEGEKQAID
jgi:hypothetical protein